jgi:hypothetical protein
MASKSIEFASEVRPNKRARLEWWWWRPGKVVLLLQERSEGGWHTLHRTMLREQHWQRAFAVSATWIGIGPGHGMAVRPLGNGSGVTLHAAALPASDDTD